MKNKLSKMVEENRCGTFRISDTLMETSADELKAVMKHMVIIKCEHIFPARCFQYMAYSELFNKCEKHILPPLYEIIITRRKSGHKKVSAKLSEFV